VRLWVLSRRKAKIGNDVGWSNDLKRAKMNQEKWISSYEEAGDLFFSVWEFIRCISFSGSRDSA
jgi:hypothetical protein